MLYFQCYYLKTVSVFIRNSDASKEVGLEVNTVKTKYMLLCRHKNAGQNNDIDG
jgi:hypothetical protein